MKDLLLATENPGKRIEMQDLLNQLGARLVMPQDLGLHLDVAETGDSYAQNARLKAVAYARAGNLVALGDDSGLEVDALDGAPGIHSHRFIPLPGASDADRRRYLLHLLRDMPQPAGLSGWPAKFHCTVAISTPGGVVRYAEGICQGVIIPEERGSSGFGYDPVFLLPQYQQTMAELGMQIKNQVSHRARAIQAAVPILVELLRDDQELNK